MSKKSVVYCKVMANFTVTKTDGGVSKLVVAKISCILSPELRLRDKGVLILNGPPVKSSTPLLSTNWFGS